MLEAQIRKMKMRRRAFRWSLLFLAITAGFYFAYQQMEGPFPRFTGLSVTTNWTISLPSVPRWLDILVAPWVAGLFAWASIYQSDFSSLKEDWKIILLMIGAPLAGILWYENVRFALIDIPLGLVIALPITLISDTGTGTRACLWSGTGIFLMYWFSSFGLVGSVVFSAFYGLGAILGIGLGHFLKSAPSPKDWLFG